MPLGPNGKMVAPAKPRGPGERRLAQRKRGPVPKGVRDAITAMALEGKTPLAAIARDFGVNHSTVERIAVAIRTIDPERLNEIKRNLPSVLSLLAASHATKALETIEDPQASVRYTFGAKLAVEANKVAQPGAEAPGHTMLTFINQLNVQRAVEALPPVVDAVVPEFAPADEPQLALEW